MPIQSQEVLGIEGRNHPLLSRPLGMCAEPAILGRMKLRQTASKVLHRGYIGFWEIRNGRLLLVKLKVNIRDWDLTDGWHIVERGMDWMFPGSKGPVPADWFSGELECGQGLPLRVNVSYLMWPILKVLQVRRGEVIGSHLVDQRHEILTAARAFERSVGWTVTMPVGLSRHCDGLCDDTRKVRRLVAAV